MTLFDEFVEWKSVLKPAFRLSPKKRERAIKKWLALHPTFAKILDDGCGGITLSTKKYRNLRQRWEFLEYPRRSIVSKLRGRSPQIDASSAENPDSSSKIRNYALRVSGVLSFSAAQKEQPTTYKEANGKIIR